LKRSFSWIYHKVEIFNRFADDNLRAAAASPAMS